MNTNKNVKNIKNNKNVKKEVVKVQSDSCVDEIVNFYNSNIGIITQYSFQVLKEYESEMGAGLVMFAMQKAVESDVRNIRYIKVILNSWSKKGIRTLVEAKEEEGGRKRNGESRREYLPNGGLKDKSDLFVGK